MSKEEENFHFYVEIKKGKQQEILRKIFEIMDEHKEDRKGWISFVGTFEDFVEELEREE